MLDNLDRDEEMEYSHWNYIQFSAPCEFLLYICKIWMISFFYAPQELENHHDEPVLCEAKVHTTQESCQEDCTS